MKDVMSVGSDKRTTEDSTWSKDIKIWFVMVKDAKGRFPKNDLWGDGWEPSLGGFPALSAMPAQFVLKDVVLLGASLWTAGEALAAQGLIAPRRLSPSAASGRPFPATRADDPVTPLGTCPTRYPCASWALRAPATWLQGATASPVSFAGLESQLTG